MRKIFNTDDKIKPPTYLSHLYHFNTSHISKVYHYYITTYHTTFLLTWCMLALHAGLDHPLVEKLCKYHLLSLYIETNVGIILGELNC